MFHANNVVMEMEQCCYGNGAMEQCYYGNGESRRPNIFFIFESFVLMKDI